MPYQVRLSHIRPDYSVEPPPTETWSAVVEDDDDLIVMMNRVAITSSQNMSHEYPVLDVVAGSIRATITVIGGQLYYTDPNAPNRSNIKVVADGALQLLHGSSFESVLQAEVVDDQETFAAGAYRRPGIGPRVRGVLLVILLVSLLGAVSFTWQQLTHRARLVPSAEFVPGAVAGLSIRAYAGVYFEGFQEGGIVLELTNEGLFKLYRMWHSAETGGFTLKQVESLSVKLGAQYGKPALMADEYYLLLPRRDEKILMGNTLLQRHQGALEDIGELR
jgi:hypothetical protein